MFSWLEKNFSWLLWPLKGFDQEFLRSDVIGNYSRPYSWQANQLGHATIGLTTALIFAWMTEHLSDSVSIAARYYRQVLEKVDAPLIGQFSDYAAQLSIALFALPLLAVFGQLLAAVAARSKPQKGGFVDGLRRLGEFVSWTLWFFTVILAAMLVAFAISVEVGRVGGERLTENLLHGAATVTVVSVSYLCVLLVIWKLFGRIFDFEDLPDRFFGRASYAIWRAMLIAGLGLGVALVIYLFADAFGVWSDREVRVFAQMARRLETAAVVMVAVTFSALAALESRTPQYTILSWLVIAAAVLMFDDTTLSAVTRIDAFGATDAALYAGAQIHSVIPFLFASCPLPDSVAVVSEANALKCGEGVVLGAISLVILATLVGLIVVRVRNWRIRLIMAGVFLFFLFLVFVASRSGMDSEPWRKAIAAVLVTLAVWWVKEFGNDIVRVDAGIDEARLERELNGYPSSCRGVSRNDDLEPAILEYRRDALADAFTDSLFYLTGAAIGAGILYASYDPIGTQGLIFDTAWRNLPATIGFAFFIGVYVGFGYSWTRRYDALDEIQVFQAFRFGVMESAIRVDVYRGRQDPGAEAPAPRLVEVNSQGEIVGPGENLGSMQALLAFSRGGLRVNSDAGPGKGLALEAVQHMIIAGRFGSGRTDLGNAMASEAALCNIPPLGRKQREKGLKRREARYFTLKNVLDLTEIEGSVIAAQPQASLGRNAAMRIKQDLRLRVGKPDVFVLNEADPFSRDVFEAFQAAEARVPSVGGAEGDRRERVVDSIDDEDLDPQTRARHSEVRRWILTRALNQLEVEKLDQTVWIINADVERPSAAPGAVWNPRQPVAVTDYMNDLAFCLADRIRRAAVEAAEKAREKGFEPEPIPDLDETSVNIAVAMIARRPHAISAERM